MGNKEIRERRDLTSQRNLTFAGNRDNHQQWEGQGKKGHFERGKANRKSLWGKVQEEFTGISPMPGSRLYILLVGEMWLVPEALAHWRRSTGEPAGAEDGVSARGASAANASDSGKLQASMGAASSLMGQPVQHTAQSKVREHQACRGSTGTRASLRACARRGTGTRSDCRVRNHRPTDPGPAWLAGAHGQALTTQFPFCSVRRWTGISHPEWMPQ